MSASRKQILIVDDNEIFLELLLHELESSRYSIETAASGEAAVAKITQCRPDILLLDYRLPDIDGLEVLDRLPDGAVSQTAIFLISAIFGLKQTRSQVQDRLCQIQESRSDLGSVTLLEKETDFTRFRANLQAHLSDLKK